MLGPALIIGCGGSGGKTFRVAHSALERRFRRLGYPSGFMPAGLQFLHVDVPPKQEGSTADFGDYLPGEDYVSLVDAGIKYKAVDSALLASCEGRGVTHEMVGWRPNPAVVRVAIEEGAGQFRALGRIIAMRSMGEVYEAVSNASKAFSTGAARDELDELSGRLGFPVPASMADRPPPLAIVVSSLAGGTGAGCFLDVCDLLRSAFPAWGDHALAVLYAPDVFAGVAGTEGIQSNALAALSELLAGYWSTDHWNSGMLNMAGVPEHSFTQGGAAHPFIIGSMNSGGVSLGNPKLVYRAVGEALAMIAAGPNIRENVVRFLMVNWQANAERNADSLKLAPANTMAALSSFGFARAGLGRERFEDYTVKRLARDGAEFLSSGYLLSAQNMFPGEELTPSEARTKLVKHLSVRFLTDCRLHERDSSDQIIDALRHPEMVSRWQGLRAGVMASIERADPAPPTVWSRRITEEIDPRGFGFQTAFAELLSSQLQMWVEQTPDHVVDVVSLYASRYGVPIARSLVEGAIAEMRSVADQLVGEAGAWENEANQWSGRLDASLPPGSANIVGSHPQMAEAVKQAASRLWAHGEAELRRRGAEAMLEMSSGFLTPMLNALTAAQNGLEADLGPQPNGEASEVLSWPKEDSLPTWLYPSDIEFLLEPVDSYPASYVELVRASVDEKAGHAAGGHLLAARHQVISGGFDIADHEQVEAAIVHGTGAGGRDTAGRWQPRCTGNDGMPAQFTIRLRVPDLVERATAWVSRPGTKIERYLRERLSDYLLATDASGQPVVNHEARLTEFRTAFGKALNASSPLVKINTDLYSTVHPATRAASSMLVEPIPFDSNHPARQLARDLLIANGVDANEVDSYFASGSSGSISAISYLELPAHPVVFQSLMQPIAQTWQAVDADGGETFWRWCRSRPLNEAVPVPSGVRRAMIRGWFTARLLGLVDAADPQKPIRLSHPRDGVLRFPTPLLGRKMGRRDHLSVLPAVLESLPIALAQFSTAGNVKLLAPYQRLVELGLSDVESFELTYENLNPILEDWITDGSCEGALVDALVAGPSESERAERLRTFLQTASVEYRKLADAPMYEQNFFDLPRVTEVSAEASEQLDLMAHAVAQFGLGSGPSI